MSHQIYPQDSSSNQSDFLPPIENVEQLSHTSQAIRRFDRSDSDRVYRFANRSAPTQASQGVKRALQIIESAILQFGVGGLAISFNGGKDSTVLIHLFAAVLLHTEPRIESDYKILGVYFRCDSPFPEVDQFIQDCQDRYNIDLVTVDEDMKKGLSTFLERRRSIRAILIGTRESDPNGARLSDFDPTDDDWPSIMRVHPILRWSYTDVWQFLREVEAEWCELYNKGYSSLGSSFNTFPNPHLQTPSGWAPAWTLLDGRFERSGRDHRFG